MLQPTKTSFLLTRYIVPGVVGMAVGYTVIGYVPHAINHEFMLRDDEVLTMLTAATRAELERARPTYTTITWHPAGHPAYNNGERLSLVSVELAVACKDHANGSLCGSVSGFSRAADDLSRRGGVGFAVVAGQLVGYSSGAVRAHPEHYRQGIELLAERQIQFWRDEQRLQGTGDSL